MAVWREAEMGKLRLKVRETCYALGLYELRIVNNLCNRLLAGQAQYGEFEDTAEKKKFAQETLEECIDGIVYSTALLLKLKEDVSE